MRVIVTGSRDFAQPEIVHHELNQLPAPYREIIIVHGACPTGADLAAADWVTRRDDPFVTAEAHPADWDACGRNCPPDGGAHRQPRRSGDIHHPGQLPTYCPGAGPRRNWAMAAAGADLALAFLQPGQPNRGTRNCIRACERAGIPVRRIVGAQPDQEADRA